MISAEDFIGILRHLFFTYGFLSLKLMVLLIVVIVIIKYSYDMLRLNFWLPPGPWGLPYFGYLPWISSPSPHYTYLSLAHKYGDIFSLRLGNQTVVCISSVDLLRNALNKSESIGRPQTPLNKLLGGYGIVFSEGALWKAQRPFLNTKLRLLGAGSSRRSERLESCILAEVNEFILELAAVDGKPVDPSEYLSRHVHNIICNVMMSHRFQSGDEQFLEFNKRVRDGMRLYGQLMSSEYLPGYMYLPGKKSVANEISRYIRDMRNFHADLVRKRRELRQTMGRRKPVDLLDHYLNEMEKPAEAKVKNFAGVDEEQQLLQVMIDLISAGTETSRSTLLWTLVMMVREPTVAKRVRRELSGVVADGEPVLLKHRESLVYTEAVIWETLRRACVVPLGTTHVNTSELLLGGHRIPAGTEIVPLINKINMDPRYFRDPLQFRPDRFIENGKLKLTHDFVPFGLGRRTCVGDNLARMELFLFFANLMKNSRFRLPEGDDLPSLEGMMGSAHTPHPYRLVFKMSGTVLKARLDKLNRTSPL